MGKMFTNSFTSPSPDYIVNLAGALPRIEINGWGFVRPTGLTKACVFFLVLRLYFFLTPVSALWFYTSCYAAVLIVFALS
jgi:hypothetical protein